SGYKGHGPVFAGECNRIGAALGLPRVRPAKARGKDGHLPSCAQWPHNVRPEGYYLGAYQPPVPKAKARPPCELDRCLRAAVHSPDLLAEAVRDLGKTWQARPGNEHAAPGDFTGFLRTVLSEMVAAWEDESPLTPDVGPCLLWQPYVICLDGIRVSLTVG